MILAMLKVMVRVDYVKLDRSLVNEVAQHRASGPAYQDLVQILKAGSPLVVAEGVETEAQYQALRDLGVQLGQGWYFSKSLGFPAFRDFFLASR